MPQSPKVPSFLTHAELRALWNDAIPEDIAHDIELKPQVLYGKQQLTQLELIDLAQDSVEDLMEKCSDPIAQKVLLHLILHRLLLNHSLNAEYMQNASDPRATSYACDVGKIQSMISIAESFSVHPNDFTCEIH